jgi:hypothetical protein
MELLHIAKVILSISGFCLGWRAITDTGMIFGFLRQIFMRTTPKQIGKGGPTMNVLIIPSWIGKPFVLCVTCMSSFWGTLIFWGQAYFNHLEVTPVLVLTWVYSCICASFINGLLWAYYQSKLK